MEGRRGGGEQEALHHARREFLRARVPQAVLCGGTQAETARVHPARQENLRARASATSQCCSAAREELSARVTSVALALLPLSHLSGCLLVSYSR